MSATSANNQPTNARISRCTATSCHGRSRFESNATTSQAGATPSNNNVSLVAATYFSVGQSWVVRNTQFAVSEIGSEKTPRKQSTVRLTMTKVETRKSDVTGRVLGLDSSICNQGRAIKSITAA